MRPRPEHRAFELADRLAVQTYLHTRDFPPEEHHGLRAQMRQAAISAPGDIVSGLGRRPPGQRLQHLDQAYHALRELEYQMTLAHRLSLLGPETYGELHNLCVDTLMELMGLMRALGEPRARTPGR